MAEEENEYEKILLLFSLSIVQHEAARETFKQITVNTGVHMLNFLNYTVLDQALFCDPSSVYNNLIVNVHAGRNNQVI